MVVHTFTPSTLDTEADVSNEFQAGLVYIVRFYLRNLNLKISKTSLHLCPLQKTLLYVFAPTKHHPTQLTFQRTLKFPLQFVAISTDLG